jgi:hypothetical protein
VWIGDTGATTHNTAYEVGTINHRQATAQDNIIGVTGMPAVAKTIVDIPCEVMQDGKKKHVNLKDVTYVPNSRYNLFSLTKLMLDGWNMSGNKKDGIKMTKGEHVISFNKTVHTPKGVLFVVVLKRREIGESAMAGNGYVNEREKVVANETAMVQKPEKTITINKAHDMCGHMGHVEAWQICDHFGQKISKRGYKQCMDCGKAKAKQLAVTQDNQEHVVAGPDSAWVRQEDAVFKAVLAPDGGRAG